MNVEKPVRKRYSYTQEIKAGVETVFSLLCPVAEVKWVPGWNPLKVFTESGRIEPHCLFLTENGPDNAIWLVTQYDPAKYFMEIYKIIPENSVVRMEIKLMGGVEGQTLVIINYEITVTGHRGHNLLDECSTEWFETFMERWEGALNHYLLTGEKIEWLPED